MSTKDHGQTIAVHGADIDTADFVGTKVAHNTAEIRISPKRNELEIVAHARFTCGYGTGHDGQEKDFVVSLLVSQSDLVSRLFAIDAELRP